MNKPSQSFPKTRPVTPASIGGAPPAPKVKRERKPRGPAPTAVDDLRVLLSRHAPKLAKLDSDVRELEIKLDAARVRRDQAAEAVALIRSTIPASAVEPEPAVVPAQVATPSYLPETIGDSASSTV